MGVAVMEAERVLYSDCLRTSAKLPFTKRLGILGKEIEKLLAKWHPQTMALEEVFFAKNQKTAARVAEVRGMLLYIASRANIKIFQFTPLQIKVAIAGDGTADKTRMTKMVTLLAKLKHTPKLDDEYDAIGIGLTACAHHIPSFPQ